MPIWEKMASTVSLHLPNTTLPEARAIVYQGPMHLPSYLPEVSQLFLKVDSDAVRCRLCSNGFVSIKLYLYRGREQNGTLGSF